MDKRPPEVRDSCDQLPVATSAFEVYRKHPEDFQCDAGSIIPCSCLLSESRNNSIANDDVGSMKLYKQWNLVEEFAQFHLLAEGDCSGGGDYYGPGCHDPLSMKQLIEHVCKNAKTRIVNAAIKKDVHEFLEKFDAGLKSFYNRDSPLNPGISEKEHRHRFEIFKKEVNQILATNCKK